MAADGQVVFEIKGDSRGVDQTIKQVTSNIQNESKKWDKAAAKSADSMEDSFLGMAKKVAAGLAASKVVSTLTSWGKAAVEAASDLEEVQNVVDTVFGEGSGQIETWAKKAGSQFGLTETQAKKFTSTLGAMAKSSGLAGDEIITMSTDLAGLAADMASFYNMDFETAFEKIRSGISGETMPLKQLGINMSVANMEAFALQQGLEKTFSQMSQGEQTMLRYQYLMSVTSDAQGDFARTSDGYANSIRLIETNIENLKTKIGNVLLPEIGKVTTNINKMFEKLAPTEEDTVFDQLSRVQLKTAEKIESINQTADQARALTEQLAKIENTKAGESVQEIVDKLSAVDFSQGNAAVVNEFLSTLYANIEDVASVRGESVEEAKAWLDGLAESANKLDPSKGEDWKALLEAITGGLPGLEDTEGGKGIIEALQLESGAMKQYLDALGIDSSAVADKQALWLEVCKRLVQTLPGLSSIINTQTGEVKGGIQAITDYINEWEAAEEKAALLAEIAEERKILSERYADRFSMKVDVVQAEAAVDRLQKKMDSFSKSVKDSADQKDLNQSLWGGVANYTEEEKDYLDTMVALSEAKADLAAKQDKLNGYMVDYEAGLKNVEERETAVKDKYGEITQAEQEAAQGAFEWSTETQAAFTAAQDALKAVNDYVKGVHDATAQAVDSVIKGFSKITLAGDELREKSNKLAGEEVDALNKYSDVWRKWGNDTDSLKKMGDNWDKLSAREQEAYNTLVKIKNEQNEVNKSLDQYSAGGMKSGLQSQIEYMQTYLDNLEKAKAMGLSNDLLAFLSDGSTESAEYLSGLVSGGEAAAKEVDKTFQELQAQKKNFTDTLTEQKLTVDETYQAMMDKAKEAVAAINLGDDAAAASGATVAGIAAGISEHQSEVSAAVDGILSELNRLQGWGIKIDLGAFGSFGFSVPTPDGSHASGLDYVPFNGYLAQLHRGESILTAAESELWRSIKYSGMMQGGSSGGVSSDMLDAILGSRLEGVKAGGNVYLDGRTVGQVVSAIQGNQYRSLRRSGWHQ